MSSTVAGIFETMAYGPAPETKAPALEWIKVHRGEFGLVIGGEWVAPQAGERFETINPATREVLARVAQADAADVDRAVRAARAALPAWRALSGHARARHLYALARDVQRNARLLAVLASLRHRNSLRQPR